MTDQLRLCPLCGAKPEMQHGMGESWIRCPSCQCGSGMESDERRINWNTRPIEDALVNALEECVASLDELRPNHQSVFALDAAEHARAALALAKGGK